MHFPKPHFSSSKGKQASGGHGDDVQDSADAILERIPRLNLLIVAPAGKLPEGVLSQLIACLFGAPGVRVAFVYLLREY